MTVKIRSSELTSKLGLVGASLLIHLWLTIQSRVFSDANPFGDISIYNYWFFQVENGAPIYGLQADWIYPVLAFLPIWLAGVATLGSYEISWLIMVFLLNTAAALALYRPTKKATKPTAAGWFYLAGLLVLGPVAVSRIDAISVALAVFGIVLVRRRGITSAAILFTIASWIKIWPIALFAAMIAAFKQSAKALVAALSISISILLVGFYAGGQAVLSFIFGQQDRGIQIEAVIATPWMWLAKFGLAEIYFDEQVITNQVSGPLVSGIASYSNLVMFLVLGAIFVFSFMAKSSGRDSRIIFFLASFAGVLALIIFNKVGSPQFMLWLIAPVVAGLIFRISKIKLLAFLTLGILLLTQLIYPIFYIPLLALEDYALWLLTLRNLLLVVLFILVISRLAGQKPLN